MAAEIRTARRDAVALPARMEVAALSAPLGSTTSRRSHADPLDTSRSLGVFLCAPSRATRLGAGSARSAPSASE